MQNLHECYQGHIMVDNQSGQTIRLLVPNGWACSFYRFDAQRHFMLGDKSPDGVLLVRTGSGRTHVCFVEMKISAEGHWDEARQQLEMGIVHFAPLQKQIGLLSHGDLHHARWRDDRDRLEIQPEHTHSVWGLLLTRKRSGRSPRFSPAQSIELCDKRVRFAFALVSEREIDLPTLLERATIPF